ncbi:unnamed protein product [Amoebophrya sp. A120]|nr:unnamed protein product [Amoebophrya sp. A120]|eukprot:GSA120T00018684001.1
MPVLTLVAPGRFLDGAVFSFLVMMLGGIALFFFGNFYTYICVTEVKKFGMVAQVLDKMFPMPGKKWNYNLTHVLLFSILIALLSMMHHPAQDYVEENAMLAKKKKEKADAKEAEKKKDS